MTTLIAQDQFYTVLRNGGNGVDVEEVDGSYIMIGREYDSFFYNHIYFHKLNTEGDSIGAWSFQVDTGLTTELSLVNSVNSGFISGFFWGEEDLETYGYLMSLSEDYSELNSTTSFNIGSTGTNVRINHHKNDSTLIVGGIFRDNSLTQYSVLMEMDTSGNINWTRDFYCGNNCILWPYHIENTLDGGYLFTCQEFWNSGGSGTDDYQKTAIIKTDELGFEEYRYHPGDEDYFTVAGWTIQANDSNYITAYSDPSFAEDFQPFNPNNTIWIVKFDIDGNEIWEINLYNDLPITEWGNGLNYTIKKMMKTEDGYIIGGSTTTDGFLIKIDFDGDLLWKRYFTHPQYNSNTADWQETQINGFSTTSDSGYVLTGYYACSSGNIYPTGIAAAIVIKVDEFGCLEPGCQLADNIEEITKNEFDFQLFPNPVLNQLRISLMGEASELFSIRIFDLKGSELIYKNDLSDQSLINVHQLERGMYLIQVEFENGARSTRKFIKE